MSTFIYSIEYMLACPTYRPSKMVYYDQILHVHALLGQARPIL